VNNSTPVKADVDRRRSGYVRHFNVFDVFVFNVMGFALGLALSTNPPFIGGFAPSANVVGLLSSAAVLALLNGLVYGWFGAMVPSTGGDYVFVSRTLGGRAGFVASWGFTISQVYGMAISIGWILTVAIAPGLETLGAATKSSSLTQFGNLLSSPKVVLAGTLALLLVYFLLSYFALGTRKYVIYLLFGVGLLGPALMIASLLSHTHEQFVVAFDQMVLNISGVGNAYEVALATGRAALEATPLSDAPGTFQALPLGFLCFMGFTYSVYAGGEIVDEKKAQTRGILAALALGYAVFAVGMGSYVNVVGREFHTAIGLAPVTTKLGLSTNALNLTLSALAPNTTYNVLMQVGNLIWFLMGPYIVLEVCIHNLIAWRDDHLMPERLGHRGGRANTPWVAAATVCGLVGMAALVIYSAGFTLTGYVALAAVPFLLTALSAMFFPKRQATAFAEAPALLRSEVLGTTLFQAVGFVSMIGFVWVLRACIVFPAVSGGTSKQAGTMLVIVYGLGLLIYEVARRRFRQRAVAVGVDINALLSVIPHD
jgi:APA family basic amino acid/polyamine antiporter